MISKINPATWAALAAVCLAAAAILAVLEHRRRVGDAGREVYAGGRTETSGPAAAHENGTAEGAKGGGGSGAGGAREAAGSDAAATGPTAEKAGGNERRIERIYITTAHGTPYQIRKVYEPRKVPRDSIPDAGTALEAAGYSAATRTPDHALLFESETETRINTFGRPVVTVAGIKQWVDPATGNVLAFDFAQTTGSAPQRIKGCLAKGGFRVRRVIAGEEREGQTIPLPPQATIPPDMDFVHRYFAGLAKQRQNPNVPEKTEEGCTFDLFFPEAVARLLLSVKPAGVETLSVGGRNVECARYEAWAAPAAGGAPGVQSRQTLFFSRGDGRLVRRDDYDNAGGKVIQVTEIATPDRAGAVSELAIAPPKLEPRKFDWPLGEPAAFKVFARGAEVGAINVAFRRPSDQAAGAEEFEAEAEVDLSVSGARRRERAVTRFDSAMRPLHYSVKGREIVENEAEYSIEFSAGGGKAELRETRRYRRTNDKPDKGGAPAAPPPSDPPERKTEFPLSEGVFLFDHHRVEHAIAIFSQIPLVHDSKTKVGIFLVRRNLPALVEFYVRDLRQAAAGTEGKQPRPGGAVWEISSSGVALPGRALLDERGRLVSFSLTYGGMEMSYVSAAAGTAAEAGKRKEVREIPADGPRPLRPPGW